MARPLTSPGHAPAAATVLPEHRHALPPRTRHACDIRAPERTFRAEGVIDLADVGLDIAMGIGFAKWLGARWP
jgi:hypothetical protein